MHVVYGFQKLEHVVFDPCLGQVVSTAFNSIVEIHIHQLEYKCESTCGLIIQHLIQLNDLGMGTQTS